MAVKIESREELGAWLEKQPREVSVAMAARAALRVLPMIETARRARDFRYTIVLPVFRATAIAWAAARYPAQATAFAPAYAAVTNAASDVASAAAAANYAYASEAAYAAAAAAAAATYADVTTAAAASAAAIAADAAAYAADAAAAATNAFWLAVSTDATDVEEGEIPSILVRRPLWRENVQPKYGVPEPLWSLWQEMKAALLAANEDWQVWTIWYEDRLKGGVRDEERELAYARIEEELWQQGPAAVNAEIKRRIGPDDPPQRAPDIPPQRPAALEPIWENGKLVLPPGPVRTDGDVESLLAALKALRGEITDLADDADGEVNSDRRAIAYLRRTAERISDDLPSQDELFRLAHTKELLESYAKTVTEEWPEFLAKRYHALTLHFDRTVRQIPKWREFVRNAADKRLTPEQSAEVPNLARGVVEALRDDDAREFVGPSIADALQLLQALLQPTGESGTDRLLLESDQIKPGLAEDVLESINNVIKRAVEPVLSLAKEMTSGYSDRARKSLVKESERLGDETGPAVTRWLKRAFYGGGLIAAMSQIWPEAFKWLEAIKPFLNLH